MAVGSVQPFTAAQTVSIAAGIASVSVAITPNDSVLIYNAATVAAFVAFGTGSATATLTGSVPVPAGAMLLLGTGPNVNTVAAILASGTGTVYVTAGAGTQH